MIKNYQITQITLSDDGGLQIGFFDRKTDVKAPGVAMVRTLIVPAGYDYDDEIRALLDAAVYLVNDVLDDWDTLPAAGAETSMQP